MVEIMAKETEKKKAEEAYFITTKNLPKQAEIIFPKN